MSEDSLLSRLADEAAERQPAVDRPAFMKGWEPHVEQGAMTATAVSEIMEVENADEATLIRGWGLDPDLWQIVPETLLVNKWQGMKGKKHNNDLVWMYQYKAKLRKRITAEDLPLGLKLTPSFDVRIEGRPKEFAHGDLPSPTWRVGVFYPDPQFGYWWDEYNEIHTIHDERCFNIRNQVLLDIRAMYGSVSKVVGAGDTNDWSHFSRFTNYPNYIERTLQFTLDRTTLEWEQLRAICDDVENEEIVVLDGNHDNPRLITALIKKGLGALVGVRQGGTSPEEDAVLSMQHLTQMSKYDIQYIEPYPTGRAEFNSKLGCAHGPAYSNKKGGTAQAILAQSHRSMLHGHSHREEALAVTMWTDDGPRTFYVGSPGSFCRTDLVVPSTKSNPTSKGVPAVGRGTEDWQQGFFVVTYDTEGSEHFNVEPVRIWNRKADEPSVAYWRGGKYVSTVDADGNPT